MAATELPWTLVLAMVRKLVPAAVSLAAGKWERAGFMGTELAGKTLGVIGLGRIGREVATGGRARDRAVVWRRPVGTGWIPVAAG